MRTSNFFSQENVIYFEVLTVLVSAGIIDVQVTETSC